MSKEFKVFNLKLQLTTQGSAKGGHPTKTPNRNVTSSAALKPLRAVMTIVTLSTR